MPSPRRSAFRRPVDDRGGARSGAGRRVRDPGCSTVRERSRDRRLDQLDEGERRLELLESRDRALRAEGAGVRSPDRDDQRRRRLPGSGRAPAARGRDALQALQRNTPGTHGDASTGRDVRWAGEPRTMGRRSLLVVGLALALVFAAPAVGDDIEDRRLRCRRAHSRAAGRDHSVEQQEGVLTSQLSAVVSELGAAQAAVEQAQSSVGLRSRARRRAGAARSADGTAGRTDASPRTPPGRIPTPSGSSKRESRPSTSRSHLTFSRSSSRPELRRPDRQLRVREPHRCAGQADRVPGWLRRSGRRRLSGSRRRERGGSPRPRSPSSPPVRTRHEPHATGLPRTGHAASARELNGARRRLT